LDICAFGEAFAIVLRTSRSTGFEVAFLKGLGALWVDWRKTRLLVASLRIICNYRRMKIGFAQINPTVGDLSGKL
jgi:hypothetical protein